MHARPRRSSWLRLPDEVRFLTRSGAQAVLAGVLGILLAVVVSAADRVAGLTLPAAIDTAEVLLSALVGAMVTLAVFTLWMRSIVAGLASSQVSPRIVSSYLDDSFQWRLLVGMSAAITFTSTVLLGLPVDRQTQAPALSVGSAVLTVVLGLVMVLMALRQGVHSLAPPRIVHALAEQARGSIATDGVPDDGWPEDRPRIPSEAHTRIAAQRMGWLTDVDHARLMDALPEGAHLGLYVDVGAFVGVGDVLAICDVELSDEVEDRIRRCLVVDSARSPDTDLGFALQQLRDLAQQALGSRQQDTSTAIEALLYLRAVLGELIAQHEPTGDALGPDGRAVTSAGRRRVHHHLRETLEPLVYLASEDPLSAPDVRAMLDDLLSETEHACGALDRDEVLRQLVTLRERVAAAQEDEPLAAWGREGVGSGAGSDGSGPDGGRAEVSRSGARREPAS